MKARKRISQRQARFERRMLEQLQSKYNSLVLGFGSEFPGTHIRTIETSAETTAVLDTAQRLKFALAARMRGNHLEIYAVRRPA
jgi:hypothetical protein